MWGVRGGGDTLSCLIDCSQCVSSSQRQPYLCISLFPSLLLFGLPQKVTKKARAVEADFSLRYNEFDRFKKRGTQMVVFY